MRPPTAVLVWLKKPFEPFSASREASLELPNFSSLEKELDLAPLAICSLDAMIEV